MASKLKHSKLKNTGIIFELLVRQIAADTLENKDSKAIGIIKKYFSNTQLAKEYGIYKILSSGRNLSETKGNILINSAIESQKKLNQPKLKKEKYELISEIKDNYDLDAFFKSKIDNYKIYASIYMLFECKNSDNVISPKTVSNYEYTILENLTGTNPDKEVEQLVEDKGTGLLVYQLMVKKFNEKYKSALNTDQKKLLKEYVNNVTVTEHLKDYINEEIKRLQHELVSQVPMIKDEVRKIKVKQLAEILKVIPKNKSVTDEDVENLFKYYQLVEELGKVK